MKLLLKTGGFGGGAPKSLLSYGLVAKANGIETIAVGEKDYSPELYTKNEINVISLKRFKIDQYVSNLIILFRYVDILKKEKPDVIHTVNPWNIYYHTIIEELTGVPIIYTIPGGTLNVVQGNILSILLKEKDVLVFSEENKEQLEAYGLRENKITVIPNRLDISPNLPEIQEDLSSNETLLLISRFSKDKIKSIYSVIDLVDKLRETIEVKLTILGDGEFFGEVQQYVKQVNNKHKDKVIDLQGFQPNVQNYIDKSDFIFGKGRSVLDGIFSGKTCFVVNEQNNFFLCTNNNFNDLSKTNLTGRGLQSELDFEKIKDVINEGISKDEKVRLRELANQSYNIWAKESEILEMYQAKVKQAKDINYSPSKFKLIILYCRTYYKMIRAKLKSRK